MAEHCYLATQDAWCRHLSCCSFSRSVYALASMFPPKLSSHKPVAAKPHLCEELMRERSVRRNCGGPGAEESDARRRRLVVVSEHTPAYSFTVDAAERCAADATSFSA